MPGVAWTRAIKVEVVEHGKLVAPVNGDVNAALVCVLAGLGQRAAGDLGAFGEVVEGFVAVIHADIGQFGRELDDFPFIFAQHLHDAGVQTGGDAQPADGRAAVGLDGCFYVPDMAGIILADAAIKAGLQAGGFLDDFKKWVVMT